MTTTLRLTETAFQRRVIDAAKVHGWKVAHFRPARTEKGWRTAMEGDAGFPDLVLARRGRVIFAELKVNGQLSKEQAAWADALDTMAHINPPMIWAHRFYLWTPSDWPVIEQVLR